MNKRSKHIDVQQQFINEKVNNGIIKLKYLPTGEELGNIRAKKIN